MQSPYRYYVTVWLMMALVLTGASAILLAMFPDYTFPWPAPLWAATNLATFLLFGLDKSIAGSNHTRVPEKILLLASAFGGPAGSLLGMQVFRHKTRRPGFGLIVAILSLAQVGAIIYYWQTL